jgi:formamidopyrimidine-DNA glycosylase
MPELPEVETVRRHLAQHLPGQRIDVVDLRRADLRYPIPMAAARDLAGRTILAVRRRAKYLLLDCERDGAGSVVALVHLGMSGRLFVDGESAQDDWQKHEHWRMLLTGPHGPQRLRYVDARRFGALDVFAREDEAGQALLKDLGPEPLGPDFTAAGLHVACQESRVAIKGLLMDSHRVVGIGNIYASETCFRARVHPLRPADRVTEAECIRLVASARSVLEDAIAAGGSTLKDFVGGDAAPGYFQQQLDVYGREGEPCTRCGRDGRRKTVAIIERSVLNNRATFWCPACQV